MSDTMDDVRTALTGWFRGKSQDSGKGGDRRERAVDDVVDEAVTGASHGGKPQNQSTDASNGY